MKKLETALTQQVLAALYETTAPISGEDLAEKLAVSRTAIWKAIGKLRSSGYKIDAAPNRGYQLVCGVDIPYPQEVQRGLETQNFGHNAYFYQHLVSTNDTLRTLAKEGASEGTLVIAEQQQQGRGRWGRAWQSEAGENLTFSLLLRPHFEPRKVTVLAPMVGVACLKVLRAEPYGLPVNLKWPNDLLVNGKKLGGILIELSLELERIHYAVLGLGINVNANFAQVDFPATSLKILSGQTLPRVPLLQKLLLALEEEYQELINSGSGSLLSTYRQWCETVGQEIAVYSRGELVAQGTAQEIDPDFNLVVATAQGPVTVTSAEVSLRGS